MYTMPFWSGLFSFLSPKGVSLKLARHSMPMVAPIWAALAAARNSSAPAMESWSIRPQVHRPAARAKNTAAVGE